MACSPVSTVTPPADVDVKLDPVPEYESSSCSSETGEESSSSDEDEDEICSVQSFRKAAGTDYPNGKYYQTYGGG